MRLRLIHLSIFLIATCLLIGTSAPAQSVRFDRDIRPILSDKCFHCHGPDEEHREAELRLDLEDAAKESVIVPGKAGESELVRRVMSRDPDEMMPPPTAKKPLKSEEVALLKRWVEEGAEWTAHWAFLSPTKSVVPQADEMPPGPNSERLQTWPRNTIDQFILARLVADGFMPSEEADRRTLIRRVSFDLTGLPPMPSEVNEFVNDDSDNAYEKVVDRLLKSPHYGERMALMWLDAARYGDTSVFHADGPRDMWAWRDLVVKSYNKNQPFDEFSIEQLAGDLLPNPTIEQQVASGFNRNNGTTDEGGAIAEEYRIEYVVDRVKTTSTVWLGLTMECAQCHDHKYDPISQADYYRFFSFFNVSEDAGMQTRNGNAAPTIAVPDPLKEAKLPETREQLATAEQQLKDHVATIDPEFQAWLVVKQSEVEANKLDLVPTDALLHFALDEGEGRKVADTVNSKREGDIKGKEQWVAGHFDQALKLDGSTYVDLGNLGDFERSDKFSYGGWVRPEGMASGAVLARMDNADNYRGYDMLLSDGYITVHIINTWPGNAIKIQTKKRLEADKWQHVFATYDGSSKAAGVKVYVNGESWEWDVQQDGLSETIRTKKTLLIGSRHPDARYKGIIDDLRMFDRELQATEVQSLAGSNPITPILHLAADQRTPEQVAQLREFYLNNADVKYQELEKLRDKLKADETELQKPLTTVMMMRDTQRDTFILNRGSYSSPTDRKVTQATPAILPPMPQDAPTNRLGLARWLFQPDHPLTARVAVNRYWQMLFGTGLVSTPEDFGSQGDYPSHPELLDYLATDFRESGWDIKRMIKQLVMSATYRQSAKVTPESFARDPDNRLLGRGPRFRLQGEFIRDNALMISGLLNDQMGGPGVKPYQPPGLWAEVGLGGNPKFVQDHNDKLYRRSLYTYWKRSAPPPSMQIFDAPTREKCTIRRPRTNTPLQALVTLNDVQFVEAARNFAQRMMLEGGELQEERLAFAYLQAVAREPSESERAALLSVFTTAIDHYKGNPDAATQLLSFGESKLDESLDAVELAAWTIVASSILNLDETLTRG
ncbi:MAG: DUF1553 domain-containing protein [Planctomycetaceae bacterium]|nr:DUF1553 domain-containing protein [Planctomycetales bacterium]MCB9922924.1 DUF1553 domain-containing protein [Planctomycetaceae bacterium]